LTFPLTRRYAASVEPVGTTADTLTIVDSVYESETVSSVMYIPSAALSGAATHNRTFNLYNRGTAGTGTVVVASLNMASGTDLSDNVPKAITLSTTSANLLLTAGQVLEWQSLHISNGIADPGGRVQVNTTRTAS
jgi:hypothetical protein